MNGNAALINGYCDLVNKTIYFVQNYFEGVVPAGHLDEGLYWETKRVYRRARGLSGEDQREELVSLLEDYLALAAGYFREGNPWESCRNDRRACRNTILNSVQLIANLTVLLAGVAEHPADRVREWLELGDEWDFHCVHSGYRLPRTEAVFFRSEQIGA